MSELEPTRTYSNPTATETLRRLLDERGAEWKGGRNHANYTSWDASDWRMSAEELADGTLFMRAYSVKHLSPEQAVVATLGPGTCKLDFVAFTKDGVDFAGFRCDGCGFTQAVPGGSLWGVTRDWSYCPNCGAKVVE